MRSFTFFLFLFVFLGNVNSQSTEDISKEIDKIIQYDTDITFERTPGWMIGIVIGDSTYLLEYGSIDRKNEIPPTPQTKFEIGGSTKIFTASLLEVLYDKGLMHPDSSLNYYLGPKLGNPKNDFITIKDLVQHTTCLPRMPLEFGIKEKDPNNPYANYKKVDLIKFYQDCPCFPSKKLEYNYSHVNYALLEIAIEQHLQKPYETVLNEHLLAPLGMKNTSVQIFDERNLAKGYSIAGKEVSPWDYSSFGASLGLKSNMEDFLKFAKANLAQSKNTLSPTLYKTHQEAVATKITKNTSIASGWHTTKHKRFYNSVIHSGTTSGHRSFIGVVKETNTAVVILSNSEYEMGGLGYLILRMINYNWKKRKV